MGADGTILNAPINFAEQNVLLILFLNVNNMSLLLNRSVFGNDKNKGNTLSREDAEGLFLSWVINPRLQLHMRQVAHLMKCWAAENEGLDEAGQWRWEMAGLLHDADWDQWPW